MEYLVDILMPVYNHEKYLEQALTGVVEQKTDFAFRLLIGEDCSTDDGRIIIQRFQEKYPSIIFPYFRPQNLGPYKNSGLLFEEMRGKYIALCEGDDYWTDPNKLQRQVGFLEANPDYSVCFHEICHLYPGKEPEIVPLGSIPATYTIEDLAEKGNFIYTVSTIFRNPYKKLPAWFETSPVGDYPLHMLNASRGKVYYMPEVMAAYRRSIGIYGSQSAIKQNYNWYKTLDLLIRHFETENKIVALLRKHQARSLIYMYENNVVDQLNELDPRAKDLLDLTTLRTPDQLLSFSTKQLFLAFWKKLFLVMRHNGLVNKITARRKS